MDRARTITTAERGPSGRRDMNHLQEGSIKRSHTEPSGFRERDNGGYFTARRWRATWFKPIIGRGQFVLSLQESPAISRKKQIGPVLVFQFLVRPDQRPMRSYVAVSAAARRVRLRRATHPSPRLPSAVSASVPGSQYFLVRQHFAI
jgi:hypothetical protein